jgi:predicted MFS family arabinose efflux permease
MTSLNTYLRSERRDPAGGLNGVVTLIYFCFGVKIAAMAPLITPISNELGIDRGMMGVILGAWPLTYILSAIPCGILLDRLGEKRMLLLAAILMASSGLARSYAETPLQLLLAVAIFGVTAPLLPQLMRLGCRLLVPSAPNSMAAIRRGG